jgi:type II secretory pathway component PulJ
MRSRASRQDGSSLVELLVSTVFVSIMMAISYSFARAALMTARVQAIKSDAQEATVMALDIMAHELRMAGFSAAGTSLPPIRTAAPDRVDVVDDLNGDGDTADSNERITYSYDDEAHEVRRATAGGSPQPFVRNVAPMGFHLSYFDAAGIEIPTGSTGIAPTQLQHVHRIDVVLQVEFANPDPNVVAPLRSGMSTSICLRNQ